MACVRYNSKFSWALRPPDRSPASTCQSPRTFSQEGIHHIGVQTRAEQSFSATAFRANRSKHPEVFVFGLPNGIRARTFQRPHVGRCSLLAETGLVLKEDTQSLLRMRCGDFRQTLQQLFQKCRLGLWIAGIILKGLLASERLSTCVRGVAAILFHAHAAHLIAVLRKVAHDLRLLGRSHICCWGKYDRCR